MKEISMEKSNKYTPPHHPDAKDYMAATARAGLSLIPIAGGAVNELLECLFSPRPYCAGMTDSKEGVMRRCVGARGPQKR